MSWGALIVEAKVAGAAVGADCFKWSKIPVAWSGQTLVGVTRNSKIHLYTKSSVSREGFMTRGAGVFAYKRMTCGASTCKVFKLGICMDLIRTGFRFHDGKGTTRDLIRFAKAGEKVMREAESKGQSIPEMYRCKGHDAALARASLLMF